MSSPLVVGAPRPARVPLGQPGARGRPHAVVLDAAVAVVAAPVLALWSASHVGQQWVAVPAAVMVLALALRRVRPLLCLALVSAAAVAHYAGGHDVLPADVAVLAAVYSAAAHGGAPTRRLALLAAVVGAVMQGLHELPWLLTYPTYDALDALRSSATTGAEYGVPALAAWLAGQWRRTRIAYVASLVDRARRAEHEREQQAVIAAAAERARLAREVHDVVTHSLAVMIAQADGGRYAAAASPAAAAVALETVAATGRSALADMQRLLGVLRQDADAARAPQPDVDAVPQLVAAVRRSGLDVELRTTGEPLPLTPAAGLAAYRVVQEALTNVLKHAGPGARARVQLAWSPDALRVCVEDDGRGATAAPPGAGGAWAAGEAGGHGLTGMRERVAGAGGSLAAAPRQGRGFAVAATVPVGAAS